MRVNFDREQSLGREPRHRANTTRSRVEPSTTSLDKDRVDPNGSKIYPLPILRFLSPNASPRMITRFLLVLFVAFALPIGNSTCAMTWIPKINVMDSREQTNLDHRLPRLSAGVNSSKPTVPVDHPTCNSAQQAYEAARAAVRTLERAIYLSAYRQEVERALGKSMTDDELRVLAGEEREEAHRWYKYIQADRKCAAR